MEGKLLIVEDECGLRQSLQDYFEREGFVVTAAADGRAALAALDRARPDLIILDIHLPFHDGLELCQEIRARYGHDVDIILVSGKKTELLDKVVGLELGADAYMFKPFETRVLLAQARALLRRRQALDDSAATCGWYVVDDRLRIHFERRQVVVEDKPVHLTRLEFDLLRHLAEQPGVPFSHTALLDAVWGYHYGSDVSDSAVYSCISKLRAKIEVDPGQPQYIISIHGVGYRFRTP